VLVPAGSSASWGQTFDAALGAQEWIALSRAIEALFAGSVEEACFPSVLALLLESVQSPRGALGYLDEFGELLLPFEIGLEPALLSTGAVGLEADEWEGAWGDALRAERIEVSNQSRGSRRTRLTGARELAAPIRFSGQVVGLLYASDKAHDYDEADAARIGLVAGRVAPVLANWLAQRRFRRQLAEAEEMASAATEGERFFMMSRDMMAIADLQIRRANPAFSNSLGWEEHELRNKSIAELAHPSDRERLEREFMLMRTEPNREHPAVAVQMLTKSGETRRIEWVGAATEEGRVYAVGRDVSALSQANEKLAIQNCELQRLHDNARGEEQLAGRLLTHVRRQGCLDTPGIQYIASSLGFFNGDVALAALTPSGELRWMLGDFTGHGLSAAIGTVPLAGAFYTTCRQDVPMTEAIANINDLLKSLLPPGLFCAAGFLGLNRDANLLSVWNCALPPILVRRISDGQIVRYDSKSLPLGLLNSRELNIEPVQVSIDKGDDVYIFSDGLTEAPNASGELFGVERVERVLRAVQNPGDGFNAVVRAVAEYRGAVEASDDVSLVSVTVGQTRTLSGIGRARGA
jgi:PAS domain S-box-containing protein